MTTPRTTGGYTLVELLVSVGLFAIVMTLVAGAYFMIINITAQAEGIATSVDGISYALEDMSRTIRTGYQYGCPTAGKDCSGGSTFVVTDQTGTQQIFTLQQVNNNGTLSGVIYDNATPLTDPSVNVTALTFSLTGPEPYSFNKDINPPHVTIVTSGTIKAGKQTFPFTIETGATMRGIDL